MTAARGVEGNHRSAHPLLKAPTPAAWIARACAETDVLLIDHANCEKKAASTALSLMFAYAEDLELTGKMSRLAREELRHYEQVTKLMKTLAVVPQRLAPGRYAERLRRLVAKSEPHREVDLMICGASKRAPVSVLRRWRRRSEARSESCFTDCITLRHATTGYTWTWRAGRLIAPASASARVSRNSPCSSLSS